MSKYQQLLYPIDTEQDQIKDVPLNNADSLSRPAAENKMMASLKERWCYKMTRIDTTD